METKMKCSDIGRKCEMAKRLTCVEEPVYRMKTVPAGGVDARLDDTIQVRDGDTPIGFEKCYKAFKECIYCHSIEMLGIRTVPANVTLTFEDFLSEKEQLEDYRKKLADFDRQQAIAREQFISQNSPKTNRFCK